MIKAVSFDFWNTMFTEQPGGFKLYQSRRRERLAAAIHEHGDFTQEQLERACLLEAEAHHRIWREEHRTLATAERIGKILTHLEVSLPAAGMAELTADYEEGVLENPPVLIEGVREAVETLASRYRLGIISDVGFSPGRVLKVLLGRAGLLGLFDSMVFSDEAGCSKPSIKVFERTARSLAARPPEVVHIGDLEYTDIAGAKAAGFHAIRFTGVTPMAEDERTRADRVTTDFAEVPRLIEALDGR
jgi:putative hydrolase of the HAD superfamily